MLQKFVSLENVLLETLIYIKTLKLQNIIMTNFIQDTYWQSRMKHHRGRIVLPLFMFFDDFESGNVLGSHSGIHKLGEVYVSVPCLPPYRSTVCQTFF